MSAVRIGAVFSVIVAESGYLYILIGKKLKRLLRFIQLSTLLARPVLDRAGLIAACRYGRLLYEHVPMLF